MTSDVLLFIEDPGAANFILPVATVLQSRGLTVVLRACGAATDYIGQWNGRLPLAPEGDATTIIGAASPKLILTGTSENPETVGLELIVRGKAAGLLTLGVVDALSNAPARFRGLGTAPLAFAPDYILVPDEATRSAFAMLGHPSDRIKICGYPYYDTVRARADELDREGRPHVRRRILSDIPGARPIIAFVSEVSTGLDPSQYHRSPAYTLRGHSGKNLRTEIVLEEFLDAAASLNPKPYLVLRLHPKNSRAELESYIPAFDMVSESGSPLDVIYAADAVAGMTSTLLFEAVLLGRPTLAIVPRPIELGWLPGIGSKLMFAATTRDEVRAQMLALMEATTRPAPRHALPLENAAERVADIVADLL